jgi:GTP-binding protein Era
VIEVPGVLPHAVPAGFRCGFIAVLGRPNVGKSTLVNRILSEKVSIVSDKPNTTRSAVRGVLNRPEAQLVFVDTPGIHKPRTLLGERLNASAQSAAEGVDLICLVVDARSGIGRGDARLLAGLPDDVIVVVNKVDGLDRSRVLAGLSDAAAACKGPGSREFFPVSARSGAGVADLVDHLVARSPLGPPMYPADQVTDTPEALWIAELVREELLARTREELPHSIATRVTEWEWPRVRCEILVERDSQKGIVIGRGGETLKAVGIAVRAQMPEGAFLELHVRVEHDWQRRAPALDRLGF